MPAAMSFDAVMAQLEACGSAKMREYYARSGAGPNQFGVPLGKVRSLAKKIKTDHSLAQELWFTGNADAMILATSVFDPAELTEEGVIRMVEPLTYVKIMDNLVANTLIRTPFAASLRE